MSDTSPFRQLGFEPSTTNTFASNTIKSTNAINLSYVLRAFIKTDMVLNAQDGILEEILSVGSFPPQSIVYYQQYNFDMNTREFNPNNINSWRFTLVDSYNQQIDTNGVPWAFSVVFFQRSITHELHKSELLINNEERLFKIEQQQQLLKQQLETGNRELIPSGETRTITGTIQPIFPVMTNYVLESEIEPDVEYFK